MSLDLPWPSAAEGAESPIFPPPCLLVILASSREFIGSQPNLLDWIIADGIPSRVFPSDEGEHFSNPAGSSDADEGLMPDTRLAMREFRFLDEKRKLTPLSSNEEQRWRELKQVLGVPEEPPPPTSPPPPSRDVEPEQAYYSDANGYSVLGSSEPTGLDFNPDQMYGGASPEPLATPNIGSTSPHYSPYATPGYGQSPLARPDPYRIEQSPGEDPTLPAAELLGLTEPAAVEAPTPAKAPTPADIASGNLEEGQSELTGIPAGNSEDVVELDPSEVTLLETDSNEAKAATPVPEALLSKPEPVEPVIAQTELPTEGAGIGAPSLQQPPTEGAVIGAPPLPEAPIEEAVIGAPSVPEPPTERAVVGVPPLPEAPTEGAVIGAPPLPDSPTEGAVIGAPPLPEPPTEAAVIAAPPLPEAPTEEAVIGVPPLPEASTEAAVIAAPPLPEAPAEIAPPVAAMPDSSTEGPGASEEITIDLSAAEAIDTGEFAPAQPAPAEEPPAIERAPAHADDFDQPAGGMEAAGSIAAPVFTQAPVALEEQQSTVPKSLVPGEHRVIVHTHEGQVKRGLIRDPDLWGQTIILERSGEGEALLTNRLKAIFFMVPGGAGQATPAGQKIRVTLADGRQVVGFSTDFRSEAPGFFLVPADVRTNTSRVYLFRSAVDLITEE